MPVVQLLQGLQHLGVHLVNGGLVDGGAVG